MSQGSTALVGLPSAHHALVPELDGFAWPRESLATCGDCVMAQPHPDREVFLAETRCCTYFPRLVNWRLGRILKAGGAGAASVRALIAGAGKRFSLGISASPAWRDVAHEVGTEGFGHTLALRCPHWVGGEHSCGIWPDRNHVCRTWFCKHVEGERGAHLWAALRDVLGRADRLLADALVATGEPPPERAAPEAWQAWYIDCADRLDQVAVDPEDPELQRLRGDLRDADAARAAPVPAVLGPALSQWRVGPEGGWVYGYSRYEECAVPGDIWQLLGRLDGERTWAQALTEARAAGYRVDEPLVHALHRIGALQTPASGQVGMANVRLQERDGAWRHLGMVEVDFKRS